RIGERAEPRAVHDEKRNAAHTGAKKPHEGLERPTAHREDRRGQPGTVDAADQPVLDRTRELVEVLRLHERAVKRERECYALRGPHLRADLKKVRFTRTEPPRPPKKAVSAVQVDVLARSNPTHRVSDLARQITASWVRGRSWGRRRP